MLNLAVHTQIPTQAQTVQPKTNNNDFARSNETGSEHFKDILMREAAEGKDVTATDSEIVTSTVDNGEKAATNSIVETNEVDQKAIGTTDTTELKNKAVNVFGADNASTQPENINQSSLLEEKKDLENKHVHKALSENNSGIGVMLPFLQQTVLETNKSVAAQFGQIAFYGEKDLRNEMGPSVGNTVLSVPSNHQLNVTEKRLAMNMGSGLSSLSSFLPSQFELQQGAKQNLFENNGLLKSYPTVDSVDNSKVLSFSTETYKEMLSKVGEPGFLPQTDFDAIQQTALSNSGQTLSHSATQIAPFQDISVETQIGQPKWNGELAQKIVWLVNQQHQIAEIRLNPAHLGPVEVMLNIMGDNGTQASAQFVSPHLAVREAIEAALPRLREMMAESGIQLGDVMVGAESFQHREQSKQNTHQFAKTSNSLESGSDLNAKTDKHIVLKEHNGIVNTFA